MTKMHIAIDPIDLTCPEMDILNSRLVLDNKRILELGCGRAEITRLLAGEGAGREIIATEVDEVQHAIHRQITDLPNVTFKLAGAEAIPEQDNSIDVVLMFKSLHHVPPGLMAPSLAEIHRVLKPGGLAYISEPIFAGDFNAVLRLFHDEREVREAAFKAVAGAVEVGQFELVEQIFFNAPTRFDNFAAFEERIIAATHTEHKLSPELYQQVRAAFAEYMGEDGAHFESPMRVDLLRKPR